MELQKNMIPSDLTQEIESKFNSLRESFKNRPIGKWNIGTFDWAEKFNTESGVLLDFLADNLINQDIEVPSIQKYPYRLELILITRKLISQATKEIKIFTEDIDKSIYREDTAYSALLSWLYSDKRRKISLTIKGSASLIICPFGNIVKAWPACPE